MKRLIAGFCYGYDYLEDLEKLKINLISHTVLKGSQSLVLLEIFCEISNRNNLKRSMSF